MKRLLITMLIAIFGINLAFAINLSYKIASMGIKVADLEIHLSPNKAVFKAKSKPGMLLFPHIDNLYVITHNEEFLPETYTRIIHQSAMRDSVAVINATHQAKVWQKSKGKPYSYAKSHDARDVFSFILLLIKTGNPISSYNIDANGAPWKAKVVTLENEKLRTVLGTTLAKKYQISFTPQSKKRTPYIDMLTHNFVAEDTRLTLWVSNDGIPLKATVKKNMLSMNWELVSKS